MKYIYRKIVLATALSHKKLHKTGNSYTNQFA